MKKTWIGILYLISFLSGIITADDMGDGSGLPGEYLLELAGDAQEFGRGGGSVALVDNTASLYHNPAGLGFIRYMEAMLSYARLLNGFNFYNGAFAYPFGKYGTVGIGLLGLISPEATVFDEFGIPTGETFKSSKNTIFISYGTLFLNRFAVGANVKIASHSMHDFFGMGFGVDIGFTAKTFEWLDVGLSMLHLGGPRITLDSDQDQFSSTLKFGLGSKLLDTTLSLHGDVHILELFADKSAYISDDIKKPIRWIVGASYWLIPYCALRAGINGSIISKKGYDADVKMITLGLGFKVQQFSADYALMIQTDEKDFRSTPAHSLSLRYQFGKPIPEMEKELHDKLKDVEKLEFMHEVEQLYIQGKYKKSFNKVSLLADRYPQDEEVKKLKAQVSEKLTAGRSDELFAEAQSEFINNNYVRAEELLSEIFEISPSHKQADSLRQKIGTKKEISRRVESIKSLYAQKQYEKMVKELDIVLGLDSTQEDALAYKGKIKDFLIKQETDKGYNLAYKYYYDDKDVEKANNEIQKVLSLKPNHEEAHKLYVTLSKEIKEMYLQKVGQMVNKDKLAVDNTALKELIAIDAQDQVVEARRLYDSKQFSQALAAINAVLESNTNDAQALQLKNEIITAQGEEKTDLLYNEALRFYNEKKLESTEERLNEALRLSPHHENAKKLLADVQKQMWEKNLDDAEKIMSSGKPDDLKAALKKVEDYLSVDADHTRAKKLQVDIKTTQLIHEADEFIEKGDYDRANQAIQKALTLNPDSEKVQEAFKNMKEVIDVFNDE